MEQPSQEYLELSETRPSHNLCQLIGGVMELIQDLDNEEYEDYNTHVVLNQMMIELEEALELLSN